MLIYACARRITGCWSPSQPDPLGAIEFQTSKMSGDDNFYERATRRLKNDGLLIYQWSPNILRMELDKYIWGEGKSWEIKLKQLWEYLAQYCYLPRCSTRKCWSRLSRTA